MTVKVSSRSILSVLSCLVILTGCANRQTYDKKYFILNAVRQGESIGTRADWVLEVRRFTVDSAFAGKGLVYRTGEFEYKSDFYNEFLVSPAAMITDKTRNWLAESGLFKTVLDAGTAIDATHTLEGNVTEMCGDFRDRSSPQAQIEIRIFVLKIKAGGESVPVFGQTYRSSASIVSENPEHLVEALDKCLEEILSELEKDLAAKLT